MLKNFFELNPGFSKITIPSELGDHFKRSTTLENLLYEPDSIDEQQKNLFKKKTFRNISFSKTTFKEMTFTECKFEDCLFVGAVFADVEFHKCKFINCNFYKCSLSGKCYLDPSCFEFNKDYKKTHANVMTALFQTLLDNARDHSQYIQAKNADILFLRWRIAQRRYDWQKKDIGCIRYIYEWMRNKMYDFGMGFGYSLLRFVITSVILLLVFSFITHNSWSFLGLHVNGVDIKSGSFLDSVYYTVVVTTTLGFGDIVPTTMCGRVVTSLLSIAGLIWFSLLASVIIKKVVR